MKIIKKNADIKIIVGNVKKGIKECLKERIYKQVNENGKLFWNFIHNIFHNRCRHKLF